MTIVVLIGLLLVSAITAMGMVDANRKAEMALDEVEMLRVQQRWDSERIEELSHELFEVMQHVGIVRVPGEVCDAS
ncbi:hypothetical protein CMUST_01120 [Corynebacterium mustelae]|uniref:Uncharacterized protein n=1 Tax=Corynebacterium mustelae TaxID=571915 RepID=A0A0G3GTW5_9CORY|nr:hypothetical protein [Corynebacterium mustelae]AKK04574.1 hypothetical protein CMUST_01120 [Corynebacterium mustelae]